MPLTILDLVLLAIMLLSGLLAMMRGFTREVLSIASWGAAAVAAIFAYSRFRDWARGELPNLPPMVADGILVAGTFILVLITVSLITSKISDAILDSKIGALDRTLGFVFGLGRGLLIVVIAWLFFSWLVPEQSRPSWVREARSRDVLQATGNWILAQLPDDPERALQQLRRPRPEGEGPADRPPGQQPAPGGTAPPAPPAPQRQGSTDQRGLEQLIRSTQQPAVPAR
jgi:membrane protein required for colicin V production